MTALDPQNLTLENVIPFVAPKLELRKYVVYALNGIERVILAEAPIEHVDMVPRSDRYEIEVVSAGIPHYLVPTSEAGEFRKEKP
jgi:hypothetical protein